MGISLISAVKSFMPYKGSFASNVLMLMTGTTIAQAIPIAISPILTRLYTPEDFGVLALFMSVASIISVVASGRYELAVMLPAKDEEAVNIAALAIIIAFVVSLVALVIFFLFNSPITRLLGNPEISIWLYFIPLTILLSGIYQTLNYWSNRKKQYKLLAVSRVSKSTAMVGVNLGMGWASAGTSGLILGVIAGQSIATGVLGWQVCKNDRNNINIYQQKIIEQARIYNNFPKVNSIHAFIDVLQRNGAIFLISYFFSPLLLGFYYLTIRVLQTPSTMIGAAIAQAFYQKASATYNKTGVLTDLFKKLVKRLFLIALPVFLITVFFAPSIFNFLFGSEWEKAGQFAQILSPYIFLRFIASPLSFIPLVINEQKKALMITMIGNFLVLLSIFYGGYYAHDLSVGLYILSVLLSIYFIVFFYWIYSIIKNSRGAYQ